MGPQNGSYDAGTRYADTLISTLIGGQRTDCSGQLPNCQTGSAQPSPCGQSPVLGPPDNVFLTLNAGDILELAFLCDGYIVAHSTGGDLSIFANLSAGGYGIVEVSKDGNQFETLGILDGGSPQIFSLSTVPTDQAQFVRISGEGTGVAIDAVQAL